MSEIIIPGAGFNRRSFMAAMLSACAAPAIVRASSLMPIFVPGKEIILPEREIVVVNEEWMDALNGARMAGASWSDVQNGRAIPCTGKGGIRYMGYRFPSGNAQS